MPIYAYKCESCGFAKDVLQKMSDSPLSVCPHCGAASFKKQVTAAGFQLKGSGWYVTDFRGGSNGASTSKPVDSQASGSGNANADGKPADSNAGAASAGGSAPAAPAPATPASSTAGGAPSKSS